MTARRRQAAEIVRDDLGVMVCRHETPGGAPKCALCREQVLLLHPGYQPHHIAPDRPGVPMPDHVRREIDRALGRESAPDQPDLFGDEAGDNG